MPKTPAKKNRTVAKRGAASIPEHTPPQLAAAAAPRLKGQSGEAAESPPASTIYCTIAAAHELPQALLLRDSLQAASGRVDFRLLLLEHPAVVARLRAELPELNAAAILAPDEVSCPQWLAMAFYYDLREYAAALKPALLRTLLREGNVVYLDPDIEVLAPLTALEQRWPEAEVVLLPDYPEYAAQDGGLADPGFTAMGLNLGCIGVGRGAAAEKLLAGLQEQLIEGAHQSPEHELYPEQLWSTALLAAAPRLTILRSRQYSLAPWNVSAEELTFSTPTAAQTPDGPLCLLHPDKQQRRESAVSHRGGLSPARGHAFAGAPLDRLLAEHRRKLRQSPQKRFAGALYSFGSYATGEPIPVQHRSALWQLPAVNRRTLTDPFAERPYITQLADQLATVSGSGGANQRAQRSQLSSALLGYAGKLAGALVDRTLPGGRERLADAIQAAAARQASLRYYAGQAIDKVLPGSRDRFHDVVQTAATSPSPAIRRTAAILLRATGHRS